MSSKPAKRVKKTRIAYSTRVTEKQKRRARFALRYAPFHSYKAIGKRLGLTQRQVFRIAKYSGLGRISHGFGISHKFPIFRYFPLIYKLDNYKERPTTAIFHEEGFDHQIKYNKGFESFCDFIRGLKAYNNWAARVDMAREKLHLKAEDQRIKRAVEWVEGEIREKNRRHLEKIVRERIRSPGFDELPRKERTRTLRRTLDFVLRGDLKPPNILMEKLERLESERKREKENR